MFLLFAAWCWSISWSCCGWMQCPFCLETRLWSCIPCRLPCWSFATSVHLELFVCALCGYAVAAWLHSSKNSVCDLLARQEFPVLYVCSPQQDMTQPVAQHIYQPILGQCSQDALQSASWAASCSIPIFKLFILTHMCIYICVYSYYQWLLILCNILSTHTHIYMYN